MVAKLIQLLPCPEKAFLLKEGTHIIGRDSNCEIQLVFDGVSRRHASLESSADGCVIKDLKSTNGISVNGSKGSRFRLSNGDEIGIADCVLRFEIPQEDTSSPDFVGRKYSDRTFYATQKMKRHRADGKKFREFLSSLIKKKS